MATKKLFVKNKQDGNFLFMAECYCVPLKSKALRLAQLEKEKAYHEGKNTTFKLRNDILSPYFDFICQKAVIDKKKETLTLTSGKLEKTYFFL